MFFDQGEERAPSDARRLDYQVVIGREIGGSQRIVVDGAVAAQTGTDNR